MITSSGARCDVCGNYILPINQEERVHTFRVGGLDRDLHCDNACKAAVLEMTEHQDYTRLPPGPLRTAYEEQLNTEAQP